MIKIQIEIFPRIYSSKELPKLNLKERKKHSKNIYRICYESASSKKNPLINPCKCKGSMKYIHYNCLLNCLKNKIENQNKGFNINNISYDKSLLICELCNIDFPYYIKYNNTIYYLFPYQSTYKEYLLYEILDRTGKHIINIISLVDKNIIKIGRSSSNDI